MYDDSQNRARHAGDRLVASEALGCGQIASQALAESPPGSFQGEGGEACPIWLTHNADGTHLSSWLSRWGMAVTLLQSDWRLWVQQDAGWG